MKTNAEPCTVEMSGESSAGDSNSEECLLNDRCCKATAGKRARSVHVVCLVVARRVGKAEGCDLGLGARWTSETTCACDAMTMVLGVERKR